MSNNNNNACYVLYVDHQGHPAPLTECFYATASRRLSSTVDRQGKPSTITQVDSAYCPQCLSFHDASSGSQLGYCPKPTCLQCPLCTSIVSCTILNNSNNNNEQCYGYSCGRCDWNSLQCQLTVPAKNNNQEEMTEALTKLSELLQERRPPKTSSVEDHYRKIVSAWEGVVKPSAKAAAARTTTSSRRSTTEAEAAAWSVEALESSMDKKKQALVDYQHSNLLGNDDGAFQLERLSLEEEPTLSLDDATTTVQDQLVSSLALQPQTSQTTQLSMVGWLPLSVPLRARTSRRCRAELAEGKPGILIKPKLNPLEGDSSLRTGHGQWWKKDSSAVHVIPRLKAIRYGSTVVAKDDDDNTTQQHAFLLKATNPTLGMVRLRIGTLTTYRGEPRWEDNEEEKNPFMEHLLVETVTDKHGDICLLAPPAATTDKSAVVQSELVDVESAEDTLVDLGRVRDIPEEVSNWDATSAIAAAADPPPSTLQENNQVVVSSIKMLANSGGSVWFQLICGTKLSSELQSQSLFTALPLSLQIEVGNGSWESSLIQAKDSGDDGPDIVSFDLVLAWPIIDK